MNYFNGKKILHVVKKEDTPLNLQEKTITPQNQTPVILPDSGYVGLSKVKLNGILVDPHHSYTSQTDNSVAYQKTIPTGALKYAFLDKLGGMSYKCYQLFDKSNVLNRTYINPNGNLSTETTDGWITSQPIEIEKSVSYNFNTIQVRTRLLDVSQNYISNTYTNTTNASGTITNNVSAKYIQFSIRINDLDTFMVVSGSTVPTTYQPYFEDIRDSAVTNVNDLTIPSQVQALEGYGWGVNDTCYNYIDFENKKFIQKVARIDLSTLSYVLSTSSGRYLYKTSINDIVGQINTSYDIPALSSIYNAVSTNKPWVDKDMAYTETAIGSKSVTFINNDYTNVQAFKQAMSGVYLYYELATPVETDISEYIDNNLIDVSSESAIFENEYKQDVPSEITYLIEA